MPVFWRVYRPISYTFTNHPIHTRKVKMPLQIVRAAKISTDSTTSWFNNKFFYSRRGDDDWSSLSFAWQILLCWTGFVPFCQLGKLPQTVSLNISASPTSRFTICRYLQPISDEQTFNHCHHVDHRKLAQLHPEAYRNRFSNFFKTHEVSTVVFKHCSNRCHCVL